MSPISSPISLDCASESQQKRQRSTSDMDINLGALEFAISHDAPFDMTFTHRGSDLVYKATTKARVCIVTCNTRGRSRDVARLYWQKNDFDSIKIKFSGEPSIYLVEFLQSVQRTGLEHRFHCNHEELYSSYTTDQFVLTDCNGTVVGHDNRVAAGLFRHRVPDTFHMSADMLDSMDYVFVAYICMERGRRQSAADTQSKSYNQAWQTTPGLLSFEGPWAEVI